MKCMSYPHGVRKAEMNDKNANSIQLKNLSDRTSIVVVGVAARQNLVFASLHAIRIRYIYDSIIY